MDLSKVAGSAAAAWSKSARVQLRVANTTAASMGVVRGTSVGWVRGPRQSRCGVPRNAAEAAASGGVGVRLLHPTVSLDWCDIRSTSGQAPCGFPWSLRAWFILHRMVGMWVGSVPWMALSWASVLAGVWRVVGMWAVALRREPGVGG